VTETVQAPPPVGHEIDPCSNVAEDEPSSFT